MVTPREILILALELASRADEASIRSGVSRAYYAAFLHCRSKLTSQGLAVARGTGGDHGLVQNAVSNAEPTMGRALLQLRNARNRADYDLDGIAAQSYALAMCAAARIVLTFMEAAADDDGAENADPSS